MRLHSLVALAIVLVASVDASANRLRRSGSGDVSPRGGGNPLAHPKDPNYSYCDAGIPKAATYEPLAGATLKLIQLVHRHGDRTPWHTFPEPAWGLGSWSCDYAPETTLTPPGGDNKCNEAAMLTAKGAKQLYDLGTELRGMYVGEGKPLPETVTPENQDRFYIRTTGMPRTRDSSLAFLAGLYPAAKRTPGKKFFKPYVVPRTGLETLSRSSFGSLKSKAHRAIMSNNQDVGMEVEKVFMHMEKVSTEYFQGFYQSQVGGMHLFGAMDMYHTRFCHPENKMPPGVSAEEYWATLDAYNKQQALFLRDSGDLSDMYSKGDGGLLVKDLYDVMKDAATFPNAKFQEYSGHDLSITSLLGNLHSNDVRWPPYASNILIETWAKESGEMIVRIFFNGAPLKTRDDWCDFAAGCPFEMFKKHATPLMSA